MLCNALHVLRQVLERLHHVLCGLVLLRRLSPRHRRTLGLGACNSAPQCWLACSREYSALTMEHSDDAPSSSVKRSAFSAFASSSPQAPSSAAVARSPAPPLMEKGQQAAAGKARAEGHGPSRLAPSQPLPVHRPAPPTGAQPPVSPPTAKRVRSGVRRPRSKNVASERVTPNSGARQPSGGVRPLAPAAQAASPSHGSALDAGASALRVVVVQVGSHSVRFGWAEDVAPRSVPNALAFRLHRPPGSSAPADARVGVAATAAATASPHPPVAGDGAASVAEDGAQDEGGQGDEAAMGRALADWERRRDEEYSQLHSTLEKRRSGQTVPALLRVYMWCLRVSVRPGGVCVCTLQVCVTSALTRVALAAASRLPCFAAGK